MRRSSLRSFRRRSSPRAIRPPRYDVESGAFQAPRPFIPFTSAGGRGAWELALRYSLNWLHVDVDRLLTEATGVLHFGAGLRCRICVRAAVVSERFESRRSGDPLMTYAQGRTCYDADSHIMELPDFLAAHADPDMRDRLPALRLPRVGRLANLVEEAARSRRHGERDVAELLALGDTLISGPKGYMALGAFNRDERAQALDLLGFARQLVFATFSEGLAFSLERPIEERYAAARAHNRAMAEFCGKDPRLMGVALLPLDDPHASLAELEHILRLNLKAAWVPHRPCGGRSPGHNDLDPIWARLADAGVPFVLHVAGVPLQIDAAWMNTARPVPTDWLGTGENIRGKDMTSLHQPAETFVGALVLDGVFERHRTLRGGVIELGAGWVPSMIRRLDWIADIWSKSDPQLKSLTRRPSQQIIEHMAFTPYVYEDVGDLIRQSDSRLYLFSSDYPHAEGGRHPLERFGASLVGCNDAAQKQFYSQNFARLFGIT